MLYQKAGARCRAPCRYLPFLAFGFALAGFFTTFAGFLTGTALALVTCLSLALAAAFATAFATALAFAAARSRAAATASMRPITAASGRIWVSMMSHMVLKIAPVRPTPFTVRNLP